MVTIYAETLSLPKTPSDLKTQRFRAFMRSSWYHDELKWADLALNADSLPNYGKRYRAGQRISTGFAGQPSTRLWLNEW